MLALLLVPLLASVFTVSNVCQSFDLGRPFPDAIRGEAQAFETLEVAAIDQVLEKHPEWTVCYVQPDQCPVGPEIMAQHVYDAMHHVYTSCLQAQQDL